MLTLWSTAYTEGLVLSWAHSRITAWPEHRRLGPARTSRVGLGVSVPDNFPDDTDAAGLGTRLEHPLS